LSGHLIRLLTGSVLEPVGSLTFSTPACVLDRTAVHAISGGVFHQKADLVARAIAAAAEQVIEMGSLH